MPTFSRDEIEREFQRRIVMQEKDDWKGFGETFTPDAVYVEHHEGTFKGRDKILAWLIPVMDRCRGWTYPIDWVAIDGNRVIYHWRNRLPGTRPDGSYYEFAGVTVVQYAGNGQWSFQEDIYNWEVGEKVIKDYVADKAARKTQQP
jgi:ketosteroid isomerase-like protein